jgi:predicted transcriptional regulator
MPKTASESLAGQQVVLPDSFKGHLSVVIAGFSKSSQTEVKEWETRARKQLGEKLDVYQVAVLEDAPRFVRGMITHAMKGSTPAAKQDHFLVVVKGEAELKKASAYSAADEAYVFLLDKDGEICWRAHGAVNEASLKELSERVQALR